MVQTNVHLSIDQFMQLRHEVKVCHGDSLVNHLPHCIRTLSQSRNSRHFSYNAEHVYLDLSKCNRNFTIELLIKKIQASPSEVKMCREKKCHF